MIWKMTQSKKTTLMNHVLSYMVFKTALFKTKSPIVTLAGDLLFS